MMLDENKDEPADEFNPDGAVENEEIGRASCRERV